MKKLLCLRDRERAIINVRRVSLLELRNIGTRALILEKMQMWNVVLLIYIRVHVGCKECSRSDKEEYEK